MSVSPFPQSQRPWQIAAIVFAVVPFCYVALAFLALCLLTFAALFAVLWPFLALYAATEHWQARREALADRQRLLGTAPLNSQPAKTRPGHIKDDSLTAGFDPPEAWDCSEGYGLACKRMPGNAYHWICVWNADEPPPGYMRYVKPRSPV